MDNDIRSTILSRDKPRGWKNPRDFGKGVISSLGVMSWV